MYRFAPASDTERIVYGSERPGYDSLSVPAEVVKNWIRYMKERKVRRVCCLLHRDQLNYYQSDLLDAYQEAFGAQHVCFAPIPDYHLVDQNTLEETILPFLRASAEQGLPVVVHCSGGSGRTGHVLAAWLSRERGYLPEEALSEVINQYRNPKEAVYAGNAAEADLYLLLDPDRKHQT